MSEDNKFPPPPPPDDFTKTTPNIPVSGGDDPYGDWEKTNYNIPRQQSGGDEWGKTVTNLKPIDTERQDLNKTFLPGGNSPSMPSTPDWGMTEPNINVNPNDLGGGYNDPGPSADTPTYDKTTPYFRLPEAERAKYQNLPPTPAEQAAAAEAAETAKGGIPGWVWITAAMMILVFLAIVVVAGVYIFIIRDSSYEVTIKDAPPGSRVTVDGSPLSVTDQDGTFKIPNLKAGSHEIAVVHPTYNCVKQTVKGDDGEKLKPITAGCTAQTAKSTDDCGTIRFGEDDKAERCYNSALDALPDPFTPDDLVKALNILIINFASGSAEVPQVRLAALKKGAGFIQKLPSNIVLEVGGHTDNVGQPADNQKLSEARANSVKDVLVKFGVRGDALKTAGYGSTKPLTTNDTQDGKYRNRRIEYSVIK